MDEVGNYSLVCTGANIIVNSVNFGPLPAGS